MAVVTADIILSTRYSMAARRDLNASIRRAVKTTQKVFGNVIHTPLAFRITVGDEFQLVLSRVDYALQIVVFMRALLAESGAKPQSGFRAAVGIGTIAVRNRTNPYEEDGEAFARARAGLEQIAKQPRSKRWTCLITGDARFDATADTLLALMDHFQREWTGQQWQAIRWALQGWGREEIAQKVGVRHQNVTKRLRAADWATFEKALAFLNDRLHHPEGATD